MNDGLRQSDWERIQRIERTYHRRKDPAKTLTINRIYWRRLLDLVEKNGVVFGPHTRILDMGCGGAGILLELGQGVCTGVDPLMPEYLSRFAFLRDAPVRWLEGTAEEFDDTEPYDIVFLINALDHLRSPGRAVRNLARLVAPGGHLVALVNVHTTRLFRAYFARCHRLIDPPHPHQFHRDDVPSLFGRLQLVDLRDVDHLWLDLEPRYRREALSTQESASAGLRRLLALPLRLPLIAMRVLARRPVHRRLPDDHPLVAAYLYLFHKPPAV